MAQSRLLLAGVVVISTLLALMVVRWGGMEHPRAALRPHHAVVVDTTLVPVAGPALRAADPQGADVRQAERTDHVPEKGPGRPAGRSNASRLAPPQGHAAKNDHTPEGPEARKSVPVVVMSIGTPQSGAESLLVGFKELASREVALPRHGTEGFFSYMWDHGTGSWKNGKRAKSKGGWEAVRRTFMYDLYGGRKAMKAQEAGARSGQLTRVFADTSYFPDANAPHRIARTFGKSDVDLRLVLQLLPPWDRDLREFRKAWVRDRKQLRSLAFRQYVAWFLQHVGLPCMRGKDTRGRPEKIVQCLSVRGDKDHPITDKPGTLLEDFLTEVGFAEPLSDTCQDAKCAKNAAELRRSGVLPYFVSASMYHVHLARWLSEGLPPSQLLVLGMAELATAASWEEVLAFSGMPPTPESAAKAAAAVRKRGSQPVVSASQGTWRAMKPPDAQGIALLKAFYAHFLRTAMVKTYQRLGMEFPLIESLRWDWDPKESGSFTVPGAHAAVTQGVPWGVDPEEYAESESMSRGGSAPGDGADASSSGSA